MADGVEWLIFLPFVILAGTAAQLISYPVERRLILKKINSQEITRSYVFGIGLTNGVVSLSMIFWLWPPENSIQSWSTIVIILIMVLGPAGGIAWLAICAKCHFSDDMD